MPWSGAEVAGAELNSARTSVGEWSVAAAGDAVNLCHFLVLRHPISLCNSALAPVGGAGLHAAVRAAWRAARAGSVQMDVRTSYRYHYYCLL